MIYVYKGRPIQIRWEILKSGSQVREDFTRAKMWLFLCSSHGRYAINVHAHEGYLLADVPADTLVEGTYTLEAMWVKNWNRYRPAAKPFKPFPVHDLCDSDTFAHGAMHDFHVQDPNDGRYNMADMSRARIDYLFAVTDFLDEDNTGATDMAVIKCKSCAASYGYDGLDAYQLAVVSGRFFGSEDEWFKAHSGVDFTNYYTKEEVDDLINSSMPSIDLSNYYTKEEVDALLATVDVDLSHYYTKSEVEDIVSPLSRSVSSAVESVSSLQTQYSSLNANMGSMQNTIAAVKAVADANDATLTAYAGYISPQGVMSEAFINLNADAIASRINISADNITFTADSIDMLVSEINATGNINFTRMAYDSGSVEVEAEIGASGLKVTNSQYRNNYSTVVNGKAFEAQYNAYDGTQTTGTYGTGITLFRTNTISQTPLEYKSTADAFQGFYTEQGSDANSMQMKYNGFVINGSLNSVSGTVTVGDHTLTFTNGILTSIA